MKTLAVGEHPQRLLLDPAGHPFCPTRADA
jgi:hypothetical protein